MAATVNGTILKPDGTAYVDYIRFTLRQVPGMTATAALTGGPVDALCSSAGVFTTPLAVGDYWCEICGVKPFAISILADATYNLVDLIAAGGTAPTRMNYIQLWNADSNSWVTVRAVGTGSETGLTFTPET